MTVALTDAQINDIYKGIDPIVVSNKAARMGMDSDYAMRIAFGRAVEAALTSSRCEYPKCLSGKAQWELEGQVTNDLHSGKYIFQQNGRDVY